MNDVSQLHENDHLQDRDDERNPMTTSQPLRCRKCLNFNGHRTRGHYPWAVRTWFEVRKLRRLVSQLPATRVADEEEADT